MRYFFCRLVLLSAYNATYSLKWAHNYLRIVNVVHFIKNHTFHVSDGIWTIVQHGAVVKKLNLTLGIDITPIQSKLSDRTLVSRKQTALLTAASTKPRLNSNSYKLCIYTFPYGKRKHAVFPTNQEQIQNQSWLGVAYACFPALGTGYMFSRAWHPLHVFPRLAPVACVCELWLVRFVINVCCDLPVVITLVLV